MKNQKHLDILSDCIGIELSKHVTHVECKVYDILKAMDIASKNRVTVEDIVKVKVPYYVRGSDEIALENKKLRLEIAKLTQQLIDKTNERKTNT